MTRRATTGFAWLSLPLLMLTLVLSACKGNDQAELDAWMLEQRTQTRPRVQPLAEPKKFTPQNYSEVNNADPFSNQKLALAFRRESAQPATSARLIAPEMARRKEALEAYPLDTMAMVGTLLRQGQPVALVRVDKLLYQVRTGQYLGQNFGRVTQVTENEVQLREIVQDAAGEWIERKAALQLQEGTAK